MATTSIASSNRALLLVRQCRQSAKLPSTANCARRGASQTYSINSSAPFQPDSPSRSPKPNAKGVFSQGRAPTEVRVSPQGPSVWTAIKSLLGVRPKPAADYTLPPFTAINNPYRARKAWPPNFKTLHPKHQFHYEKTYRRRTKLKYARPRWTKATKLVQWTMIYGVLTYWVFFLDMGEEAGTPFDSVSCLS